MRFTYLFFSFLLCLSTYAQPNPINRRAMAIAGLASGPWTPSSAPNLQFWFKSDVGKLKPDSTTPATNNNDPVYIWLDQSGKANNVTNFATLTTYPTNLNNKLNGYPSINFPVTAGTDPGLTNNITIPGNTWWSFFGVVKLTTAGTVQGIIYHTAGSIFGTVGGSGDWSLTGPAGSSIASSSIAQAGIYQCFAAVVDGANSIIRTNGIPCASGNIANQGGITNLVIGNSKATSAVLRGEIVELFAYNAAMDGTANLTNAEKYLKTKYGL